MFDIYYCSFTTVNVNSAPIEKQHSETVESFQLGLYYKKIY